MRQPRRFHLYTATRRSFLLNEWQNLSTSTAGLGTVKPTKQAAFIGGMSESQAPARRRKRRKPNGNNGKTNKRRRLSAGPEPFLEPKSQSKPSTDPEALFAKLVVPNTKQPLYDPLSRVLLQPGSSIRPLTRNDKWLLQRYCQIIDSYLDVSADEKEYLKCWQCFIAGKSVSDAYLPRILKAFVMEHGPWLVAVSRRIVEFGKHLSVLVARRVFHDFHLNEILTLIDEARTQHEDSQEMPFGPALSQARTMYKSAAGCAVCGLPVLGPSLLICSNKVSGP